MLAQRYLVACRLPMAFIASRCQVTYTGGHGYLVAHGRQAYQTQAPPLSGAT